MPRELSADDYEELETIFFNTADETGDVDDDAEDAPSDREEDHDSDGERQQDTQALARTVTL